MGSTLIALHGPPARINHSKPHAYFKNSPASILTSGDGSPDQITPTCTGSNPGSGSQRRPAGAGIPGTRIVAPIPNPSATQVSINSSELTTSAGAQSTPSFSNPR